VEAKEKADAITAFRQWYDSLKLYGNFPAKGTVGGALVVLERLQHNFDLSIESHTASGGSQISGIGGAAVKAILERFDETRPFLQEGGRTNRGLRGDIKRLLEAVKSANLERLSKAQRNEILSELQGFLIARVHDYHDLQRLEIIYDPSKSTWQCICDLLDAARENGKDGPVAQYLVGAKLQLRFPTLQISNESFSTADTQLGRHGDFYIGSTVLHVTVAPMPTIYDKCKRNLRDGFKVYLLVRNKDVVGTKQNAENTAPGQIVVESIEGFISQNLDELAIFSEDGRASEFRQLLETYNRRVDAAELNKSLMVEIPPNLLR
jgi:Domain of unknown function (DUF4928)